MAGREAVDVDVVGVEPAGVSIKLDGRPWVVLRSEIPPGYPVDVLQRGDQILVGALRRSDGSLWNPSLKDGVADERDRRSRLLLASGEPVRARVAAHVKGGFRVLLDGVWGFLPWSQATEDSRRSEGALVGHRVDVVVISLSDRDGAPVVSETEAVRWHLDHRLRGVQIGSAVVGRIVAVNLTHVTLDVEGAAGQIRVEEWATGLDALAWQPPDIGDEVLAEVLAVDRAAGTLHLSKRQIEGDTFTPVVESLASGAPVKGRVLGRCADRGFAVVIAEDVIGFAETTGWTEGEWRWVRVGSFDGRRLRVYEATAPDPAAPPRVRFWAGPPSRSTFSSAWGPSPVDPWTAQWWDLHGFGPDDSALWRYASWRPDEAAMYRDAGIDDETANRYRAAGCDALFGSTWATVVKEPAAALAHVAAGLEPDWVGVFDDLEDAAEFAAQGFAPADALRLCSAGFTASEADRWRTVGFSSIEAIAWQLTGLDVEGAGAWRDAGWAPRDARRWLVAGIGAEEARDWSALELDPETAAAWQTVGGPAIARPWVEHGFPVAAARDFATAGWTAGEAEPWMRQQFDVAAAGIWRAAGVPASDAVRWSTAGYDARTATAWSALGVDPGEVGRADAWWTPERYQPWHGIGLSLAGADRWHPHASLEEAVLWRAARLGPDTARPFLAAGWRAPEGTAWASAGFGVDDAARWDGEGFGPDEAADWRTAGFDAKRARTWVEAGFAAAEAEVWTSEGVEPERANAWRGSDLGPAVVARIDSRWTRRDVDSWRDAGIGVEAGEAWFLAGYEPSGALQWIENGFSPAEAEVWRGRRFRPDEAVAWSKSGLTASKATPWRDAGWEPATASPWVSAGFTAVVARSWAVAGFAPSPADEWRFAGWTDPAAAKPWRRAGWSPAVALDAAERGLTPGSGRPPRRMGPPIGWTEGRAGRGREALFGSPRTSAALATWVSRQDEVGRRAVNRLLGLPDASLHLAVSRARNQVRPRDAAVLPVRVGLTVGSEEWEVAAVDHLARSTPFVLHPEIARLLVDSDPVPDQVWQDIRLPFDRISVLLGEPFAFDDEHLALVEGRARCDATFDPWLDRLVEVGGNLVGVVLRSRTGQRPMDAVSWLVAIEGECIPIPGSLRASALRESVELLIASLHFRRSWFRRANRREIPDRLAAARSEGPVHVIDMQNVLADLESQSSGTGNRAAHYRRGHWRNQAHGQGWSEHRTVWIHPTFVAGAFSLDDRPAVYWVPAPSR